MDDDMQEFNTAVNLGSGFYGVRPHVSVTASFLPQ